MVGVTTSERRSAMARPPMTAIASGCRSSAPDPMANASGSIPRIAARLVVNTGRKRRLFRRSTFDRRDGGAQVCALQSRRHRHELAQSLAIHLCLSLVVSHFGHLVQAEESARR